MFMSKPWHGSRGYERTISGWEWQRRVQRVIQRDGGRCTLALPGCTGQATTADHRIGVAEWVARGLVGDRDGEANLQGACRSCNEVKRRGQAIAGRLSRKREPERHPGALR